MTTDHITKPTLGRRTLVAGAAWSVPVIIATAPAATAGPSQCTVNAGVNVGPFATSRMRAICSSNSQTPTGGTTIWCNYGYVYGPQYLEICNCTGDSAWYSWRETDDVSDFQIKVNGIQDDENGPNQGWRPPFKLAPVGESGGCQRFTLTYRTSDSRPYNNSTTNPTSGAWTDNTINVTLYRHSSTSSTAPAYPGPNLNGTGNGWTIVTTTSVPGLKIWRSVGSTGTGDPVNFNNCSVQGGCPAPPARTAQGTESVAASAASTQALGSAGATPGGD